MIEARSLWDLKNVLAGSARAATSGYPATYSHMDPDGTHWVTLQGSDEPIPATGMITSGMSEGDYILVSLDNGTVSIIGNSSNPSVGSSVTKLLASNAVRAAQRTAAAIKAARKIAEQAKRVADAVGQHVWSGDDGLHVTEASEDDFKSEPQGRNVLLNAYGFLLREAETWLASFTEGATAFYDGLGNAAENIVARFGTDGAAIGSVTSSRLELTETLIRLVSSDQLPVFDIDTTGSTNVVRVEFNPTPYSDYSMSSSTTASETIDAALFESGTQISFAPPSGVLLTLDHTSTLNPGQYDISSASVTGSGASLSVTMDGSKVIIGCADMTMTAGTSATYTGTVSGIKFEMTSHMQQRVHHATVDYTFTVAYDGDSIVITHAFDVAWEDGRPAGPAMRVKASYTHVTAYANVGAPIYSLGTRSGFDEAGDFSAIIGESLTAAGDNQTAIGKYNDNDPNNAFEVGNGTADDARSNAFAVGWDGTVTTARDTDTTAVADVLTAETGVTIGAVSYVQRGGVAALFIRASRSAATSGATTIGTLVTGKRPVMETAAPAPSGSGDVYVASDGTVTYRPSGTVAAGSNLYVRITYLVA